MEQALTLTLPPTLNQIINQARKGYIVSAASKKKWTNIATIKARELAPYTSPIWIAVEINYKSSNCDPDNLFAACKFVLDGLVKAQILPNDNVKNIQTPIWYKYNKSKDPTLTIRLFETKQEYFSYITKEMNELSV